jgi:hypothetical protein
MRYVASYPLARGRCSKFYGFYFVLASDHRRPDFVTDFPTCLNPNSGLYIGPIGVLFDGTHFFATDACNGYTYRFTAAGGSVTAPDAKSQNLLTDGLALDNGVYYGVVAYLAFQAGRASESISSIQTRLPSRSLRAFLWLCLASHRTL